MELTAWCPGGSLCGWLHAGIARVPTVAQEAVPDSHPCTGAVPNCRDVYMVYEIMDTDLHQIIRSPQPLSGGSAAGGAVVGRCSRMAVKENSPQPHGGGDGCGAREWQRLGFAGSVDRWLGQPTQPSSAGVAHGCDCDRQSIPACPLAEEHIQFFVYQLLRGLKYLHTGVSGECCCQLRQRDVAASSPVLVQNSCLLQGRRPVPGQCATAIVHCPSASAAQGVVHRELKPSSCCCTAVLLTSGLTRLFQPWQVVVHGDLKPLTGSPLLCWSQTSHLCTFAPLCS